MSQTSADDGLLSTARLALRTIDVLLVAAAILTGVVLAVVALSPAPQLARSFAIGPAALRPVVLLVIAAGIVELVLARLFVRQFRGILETLAQGDPFQPRNADRLQRMGWLALWISTLVICTLATDVWVGRHVEELGHFTSFPFGGLALTLTLFLLARIFRHGATMRDDAAGTI